MTYNKEVKEVETEKGKIAVISLTPRLNEREKSELKETIENKLFDVFKKY